MSEQTSRDLYLKIHNVVERHKLNTKKDFLPDSTNALMLAFVEYTAIMVEGGVPADNQEDALGDVIMAVSRLLANEVMRLTEQRENKKIRIVKPEIEVAK